MALASGWTPRGTERLDGRPRADRWSYAKPHGQTVGLEDARDIARGLDEELAAVSDTVVPLRDHPFGHDRTMELIERAAEGTAVGRDEVAAAYELLSGGPKGEARELVGFLEGGSFTIQPAG